MSEGSQLNQTRPTLSPGNIATVAAKLFHLDGGTYFVSSMLAHLWLFLGLGTSFIVLGSIGIPQLLSSGRNFNDLIALGIGSLVMLPLAAFVWGRYLASGGYISRLVFNFLTHQKETQEESRKSVYSKVWSYFIAGFCIWLIFVAINGGIVGIMRMLGPSLSPLLADLSLTIFNYDRGAFFILGLFLLAALLFLTLCLFLSYIAARLWFFDTILAIEDQVGPLQSIHRSWQLTQDQGINVLSVLLVGTVVTAPPTLMGFAILAVIPVFGVLLGVVFFPFWQAVKALQYYELRQRNEGFAFNLMRPPAQPRQYLKRVVLQTPESIELEFALGGIGSRAFAWVIDQTLLSLGLFILWYLGSAIYVYLVIPTVTEDFGSEAFNTMHLWVSAVSGLLTYALSNGYFIGFETFWRGQTPGKRWAKIRVIQDNGKPVGLRESAIRSLIAPLELILFFIGVIFITFGKSEKRLGDLVAGTLVIQDEKRQGDRQPTVELHFGERSQVTAQTLIREARLEELTADQYLILRDFLGYRTQLEAPIRKQVTVDLASQLRQIIAPPESTSGLNFLDEELLEATYLACRETVYKQA